MIEQLTGRKVLAFLSQAHIEPDLTIEMFLMDGPVPGFGALELVDPAAPQNDRRGFIGGRVTRGHRVTLRSPGSAALVALRWWLPSEDNRLT